MRKKDMRFPKSFKILQPYKSLLTYEIVRSDRWVLSIQRKMLLSYSEYISVTLVTGH